jgi:hypothetical protein
MLRVCRAGPAQVARLVYPYRPLKTLRSLGVRRCLAGSKKKSSTTSTPRRPSCARLAPEQRQRRRRRAGEEMKLKQLEGLLGGLTQFPAPKVHSATTAAASRLSPFLSRLPARFWERRKAGWRLTFAFGRRCWRRWSWSSTRRGLTSRRGCSTRLVLILLRFRCFPGREGCYLSLIGMIFSECDAGLCCELVI